MKPLRFGILATGNIAARLASTMQASSSCQLIAAASRSAESATLFAEKFGMEGIVGYEELLTREDIDAVYIATPHPQHHEWCLRAIHHGKNVLCEKPFTMTVAETEEIVLAAEKSGLLVAEAFMYRFHPQTKLCAELIRSGAIGEVRWISADFGFSVEYDPQSRLFAKHLGGGGILDVGCYAASIARLIAGAANGRPFLNPISVKAVGKLSDLEGTDWLAGALLEFPNDLLATVRCGTRFAVGSSVRVEGTQGIIELNEPWFAGTLGAQIKVITKDGERIIPTQNDADLYSFMVEEFVQSCQEKRKECPGMSPSDSIGNMRLLEDWYRQVGVQYSA